VRVEDLLRRLNKGSEEQLLFSGSSSRNTDTLDREDTELPSQGSFQNGMLNKGLMQKRESLEKAFLEFYKEG